MVKRIFGLLLVGLLLFLAVSLGSFSPDEGPHALKFPQTESFHNLCGAWGATCASFLFSGVGLAAYVLLIPLFVGILAFWFNRPLGQISLRILGLGLILCAVSTFCALVLSEERSALVIGPGGYLGASLKFGLSQYFAAAGCYIFLASLLISGLILTCEYTIVRIFLWMFGIVPIGHVLVDRLKQTPQFQESQNFTPAQARKTTPSPKTVDAPTVFDQTEPPKIESSNPFTQQAKPKGKFIPPVFELPAEEEEIEEEYEYEEYYEPDETTENESVEEVYGLLDEDEFTHEEPDEETIEPNEEPDEETIEPNEEPDEYEYYEEENEYEVVSPAEESFIEEEISDEVYEEEYEENEEAFESGEQYEYALPDVDLLTPSEPFDYEQFESTLKKQAAQLVKSVRSFNHNIRVVGIQTGPVISQFELELEPGLRLNKIQGLTDDLANALKVPTVRFVTSIPGKNSPGVEIPNENRQIVRLRDVLEETTETAKSMQVPIFLGKDVSGTSMVVDLAKMPHLLIAGRTGTGKSVCLNSIIVSMLMTRSPEQIRMILIDPKMVELSFYKSIPHLMHPVVTDMRKAEAILGWAVEKMEERYQLLARAGVRQVGEYNNLSEEELYHRLKPESLEEWESLPHTLPYMVIIVDEMSDLMMTTKEAESHITRLAQKSRGAGIHLVLATQKPTVDVVTGLIKSNLPARIAFGVASQTDSRVILDQNGAEKLLGHGDMLFLEPGSSQVIRGQGAFVSDKEIDAIIDQVGTDEQDFAEELLELKVDEDDENEEREIPRGRDVLYEKCVEYIIRQGEGSTSSLQTKFSIGYPRARKIIARMADEGVVGPPNGSKAREVVMTLHDWRKVYEQRNAEIVRS